MDIQKMLETVGEHAGTMETYIRILDNRIQSSQRFIEDRTELIQEYHKDIADKEVLMKQDMELSAALRAIVEAAKQVEVKEEEE